MIQKYNMCLRLLDSLVVKQENDTTLLVLCSQGRVIISLKEEDKLNPINMR